MDMSTDAVVRELPFDTDSAVYAVESYTDGTNKTWLVTQDANVWRLHCWTQEGKTDWKRQHDTGREFGSWVEAFAADPSLTDFSVVAVRSFVVPEPEPLLDLLHNSDIDVDDYANLEHDSVAAVEDLGMDNVTAGYATINGACLAFVADGPLTAACLVEDEWIVGATLASYAEGSEQGMTSGSSEWSLVRTSPERAVSIPEGDALEYQQEVAVFQVGGAEAAVATLLAEWVARVQDSSIGVYGAAAIELETLDPQDTLTQDETQGWRSALESLDPGFGETMKVDIRASSDTREQLRDLLATDKGYTDVRDALNDPRSGGWLLTALDEGDLVVLRDGRPE